METDNYYTPTIDEFHVGFEYEQKAANNQDWESCTFSKSNHLSKWGYEEMSLSEFRKLERIRVKYLDTEDIKSLGWKYEEDRDMRGYYGAKYIMPGGMYTMTSWFISHMITIRNAGVIIFDGTVRNKSELKKVMNILMKKQQNIHGTENT